MYNDICSKRDCIKNAKWRVIWRNPKLHDKTKEKIWLACYNHKIWIEEYLKIRSFWKKTILHVQKK